MLTPKEYEYAQANLAAKGSKAVAYARLPQENAKPGRAQRPETAQTETAYTFGRHTVNSQARILVEGVRRAIVAAHEDGRNGMVGKKGRMARHWAAFVSPSCTEESSRLRPVDANCCETTLQGSRQ